ncbi:MAG: hypothetical protein ACC649_00730, partial [Myxococcota bacterium]
DQAYSRGEFLDGAALAARELGRRDLPTRLEHAWREAPTMLRLRRWLGSATGKGVVRKRAAQALEACPGKAARQLALLHVVLGDPSAAAKLLARAPEDRRDGLQPVQLLLMRPSQDLGALANDYEPRLPRGFRFLTRGLGTRQTRSNDFLSLVMFQPDYLQHLIELGRADAEKRLDELLAFTEPNC